MKKKNLNIEKLSVKSFITELDNENGKTVKGGGHWTHEGCTHNVCEQGVTNPGEQTCGD